MQRQRLVGEQLLLLDLVHAAGQDVLDALVGVVTELQGASARSFEPPFTVLLVQADDAQGDLETCSGCSRSSRTRPTRVSTAGPISRAQPRMRYGLQEA